MPEMTTDERNRLFVKTWKEAGPLLDEFRFEEARRRTDAEAWDEFDRLHQHRELYGDRVAEAEAESGLVEQQRIFSKLRSR